MPSASEVSLGEQKETVKIAVSNKSLHISSSGMFYMNNAY